MMQDNPTAKLTLERARRWDDHVLAVEALEPLEEQLPNLGWQLAIAGEELEDSLVIAGVAAA